MELPGTDETGAGGHFNVTKVKTGPVTVTGLPPGNHSVEVSKPGYVTRVLRFDLNESNNFLNVTLNRSSEVVLNGTVTSSLGETVEDATVSIAGTSLSATTDGSGFYSVTVPAGTYDVEASKDGFIPSHSYDTVLDGDATVDFELAVSITPGSVHYELSDKESWLENNLLARGETDRSAPVRNNFFRVVDNTDGTHTVSLHVLTIEEGNYSQGGGVARVTTRFLSFNEVYSEEVENFTVTVESPVYGAWESLFEDQLEEAGLSEGTGFTVTGPSGTGKANTIRVFIEGSGTTGNDLSLRVHETRLKLSVR